MQVNIEKKRGKINTKKKKNREMLLEKKRKILNSIKHLNNKFIKL